MFEIVQTPSTNITLQGLLRLCVTQKALIASISVSFLFLHGFQMEWQKLFLNFSPIAVLSVCDQDWSY